ncbi:CDGSH iron-sulfur domain-containing protein [Methanimicrococcus blatticola]|uniref:CDGSH-type Zn-finger protein n=1 Tax=Methanimicrococcus blatticola TaxID=91560 RepID=A0A484F646_9EURY|nr:CDGSH iron-sulfur domain-containing protein [Methanimicrococcus blatticola]MBZ3935530.1 CDGSH iron-sulfur domain-containing protein [Methanimicrococcus blatticola]MCC2509173.1 CDGSH iron-sulfur domain-containing protein [Methanimicrococcus blatticola]TDQ69462.1 CDGSH-type Zn-finger protein [Methanimicrococcus blatticola]
MTKKIKIIKNGPYEVSPEIPLVQSVIVVDNDGTSMSWKTGKKYPDQTEPYYLCRCGRSDNKPYCDGAHEKPAGLMKKTFDGTEVATHESDEKNTRIYEGPELTLIDEESLCASLRFCDRGPRIWDAVLHSDRDYLKQMAIEESCDCASGRLTVVDKEGNVYEPKSDQEIGLVQDTALQIKGPLWVKGGIPVEGADGKQYKIRNRMTLCRCGESKNMPFCDTSHRRSKNMYGLDK